MRVTASLSFHLPDTRSSSSPNTAYIAVAINRILGSLCWVVLLQGITLEELGSGAWMDSGFWGVVHLETVGSVGPLEGRSAEVL